LCLKMLKKLTIHKNAVVDPKAKHGKNVSIGPGTVVESDVEIDDHTRIDSCAKIASGAHIGKHAFLGGGYRCVQDIPPYILAAGEPLKFTGLNMVGLRRRGFTRETIDQLKEVYRLIFRSEFNVSQALEQIKSSFENTGEIQEVIMFIQESKRGIIS
jgi:UDP-N-acetylglucosamine acyltransferase